jgi:hypothetical protein
VRDFAPDLTLLAHFYGIAIGKAVEWEGVPGESVYADTGRNDFEARIETIADGNPTFICLNATRYRDVPLPRQAFLLNRFFQKMYPLASPFEVEGEAARE